MRDPGRGMDGVKVRHKGAGMVGKAGGLSGRGHQGNIRGRFRKKKGKPENSGIKKI